MSSAKSQVAVATNIPNLLSGQQQQKEYNSEESLGRQNSFGLNRRGNMKGKHLTRSHAMRESTSPPRTPTPRASEPSLQLSPNGYQQQHMDINESNNKLHTQSSATRGSSPIIETPTVIVTSQHKQQQSQQKSNVALCNETEFPKLSPPKSKTGNNNNGGNSGEAGYGTNSNSGGINNSYNSNHQRVNNVSESHNSNNANNNNKKSNGDNAGGNEAHNKSINNVDINATNKNYSQSQQQQQLSAGNALQKALNIDDNTQSTQIYNAPLNYQLHPNDVNRDQQQQVQSFITYDKENRCPRNDSQNSMNSNEEVHYETQQQHQSQHHQRSGGKKHRTNSNSKGSKPRLKNISNNNGGGGVNVSSIGTVGGVVAGALASSCTDGSMNSSNSTSGFISRENSNDQYTDHGGTDLLSFFKETLNKNVKDRQFLLKIEKDLIEFFQEGKGEIRFPQASSYNRMLIHRTAAFFGMEHNVDTETQQCVIVSPTKNTRIPEIRFKTLVTSNRDDSRKLILKRDTHSFDEARQSSYLYPDRGGMLDRKAKSFEEREEDYESTRSRIFNRTQNESYPGACGSTDDDNNYISWTSSVDQQQFSRGRGSGKVLKIQSSPDSRSGAVSQKSSNNFSNYGGTQLLRADSVNSNKSIGTTSGNINRIFSKQDSAGSSNTSWRLSPSSSGYKTQTQSVRSDSITSSPTGGYGSDELHLPKQSSAIALEEINEDPTLPFLGGLMWAVSDILNVPKGSILINPQTLQPFVNADGTVYHYDPSNVSPPQAVSSATSVSNNMVNIYQSKQSGSPQQQTSVNNAVKKQHKSRQMQQSQQQLNKVDSTTTTQIYTGCESVVESSTQTVNAVNEVISPNILDSRYQEGDLCSHEIDENVEYENSINGCLSITTTTSTKNYDRIEVQKFKNQATSPNIPIHEKDEIRSEHLSQTPISSCPMQPSQSQQSQTPQQLQAQNRDTPHSARSTPFSNSDTLAKISSEEPRTTSWTQSYQAADGSTVFHTTSTPNNITTNPYCTTTYQQAPDGSIYAVPQGMLYAYPQPVEGEFQGYFMPVFDPSQQRSETTNVLQAGTQAIYPSGGTTTMVPVAAYPAAQFTAGSGAPIYPSQVIYSGEQFQAASTPLTATATSPAAGQLQQIPMTTYPIGYPYHYNGYWGQTMAYYVPQQAVPATSLLAAPPQLPSAPGSLNHVAGGVNPGGVTGGNTTAGPSSNSSNNTSNSTGHIGTGNTAHTSHQSGHVVTGYQAHMHALSGGLGSSHSGGTTYYGTGRIKRPTPQHFNSAVHNGGHQVITAATIPNGVATATYQLGHAVPTLTLAAAAPPQAAPAPPTTDLSGSAGAPSTTTMYALPQHATIFPANMFPYATNAATPSIVPQSTGCNVTTQTTIIQPSGNSQGHVTGRITGQTSSTSSALHNPQHSNTVIAPFYTATHHHAAHPGIQSSSHAIHAPGPSAIPIIDPASITNVAQLGLANNTASYNGKVGVGVNTIGSSQSAPSTPHSIPPSSTVHLSQRYSSVFSTPPIMTNNGGNFSVSSTPHYYGNTEISHQSSVNTGGGNNRNSPHTSYTLSSYERRNNNNGGDKKPLSYQSASLSRQNSTSCSGYNGTSKSSAHLNNANNNDTRASPSNSTNSRPHSTKRGGNGAGNEKSQTPLLSGPPSFVGSANTQNTSSNSYQSISNTDSGAGGIPIVNVSKPPIRLNAAAASFRQKGSTATSSSNSAVEYRRNTVSHRNSPGTNTSSNDNSNNNSPNSVHNSSNAIAAGGYAPSYVINAQHNGGEPAVQSSLYITTAPTRGSAHIPPHLQTVAANSVAVAATASIPQQAATAVLGGAAAADVASAAAVAAAAASVAHHHHHQPLLGAYNPAASGLYFKYGHTYFAHPSVALPNNRRSPSTELRPPIAQMAGMYPTVNMMIPAQPRHPIRHSNYKGTRPR